MQQDEVVGPARLEGLRTGGSAMAEAITNDNKCRRRPHAAKTAPPPAIFSQCEFKKKKDFGAAGAKNDS